MQVIKELKLTGVQEAYIPSLTPLSVDQSIPAAEMLDEPVVSFMDQLQQLDDETRQSLLAEAFSGELQNLVSESKEQGFQEGQALADKAIEVAITNEREKLVELIEIWTSNIEQSTQDATWIIEEEDNICVLLFKSLCHLLTTTLTTPTNTHEVLKNVIASYVDQNIKEVVISELQFSHLEELNVIDKLGDKVKVVADENMQPGSYRISLAAGRVEHQMSDALSQFKHALEAIVADEVKENA